VLISKLKNLLKNNQLIFKIKQFPYYSRQTVLRTFRELSGAESILRQITKRFRKYEWYYIVNYLDGIFAEAMYTTTTLILYPFGFISWNGIPKQKLSDKKGGKRPILLIHGYFHNLSGYFVLSQKLKKRGWEHVHTINLNTYTQSIEAMAREVKKAVDAIIKNTQHKKVDIIGHSLGGLVGRYYVQNLSGYKYVKNLITLATPNWGTQLAILGIGPSAKQMRPEADFIDKLNMDLSNLRRVSFSSIWSPFDALIIPPTNAILRGAGKNIKIDFVGHIGMLYSDRVFELICKILERKLY
jgi:triacylglycerol esterase/lipase EstA (alpha/beta hydrolase family)